MSKVRAIPDLIAVMAVDPGETTGIGAGFYEPHSTLKKTMTEGRVAHKTAEVYGDYLGQAKEIAAAILRFVFGANVERSIPFEHIHVVFEDFILRRRREGGATGNLTSCWVAAAAVALYEVGVCSHLEEAGAFENGLPKVAWQQPSEGYFYKDKLKPFDLYVRGSEHMRVANMHVICRVSKLLG